MRDRFLQACTLFLGVLLSVAPSALHAQPAADWLTPGDAVSEAYFGADVLFLPDGRLVVGAFGATGERPGTGAAYVFTYDQDRLAWVETAKLVAPGGRRAEGFGSRLVSHQDTLFASYARSGSASRGSYAFVSDSLGWRYAGTHALQRDQGDPLSDDALYRLATDRRLPKPQASFSDLDGRVYLVGHAPRPDSTIGLDVYLVNEGVSLSDRNDENPLRLSEVTLAASVSDPDIAWDHFFDDDILSPYSAFVFNGRFLALGLMAADGIEGNEAGAVYVWDLAGQWRSDDLAPTLPGFGAKAGPQDYVEVEVFYGTDRARTGKRNPRRFYGGRRGDELQMGTATVTIPKTHEPGAMESPSWLRLQFRADPAKHIILQEVSPLDSDEAVAAMQAALDSTSSRAVMLYVHGFNVSFEDAARRTAQMAYDLGFDGVPAFYSWPSDASLLRYLADENDVMWSVFYLKAFLREIALRSGAADVHIVAHSMGNRAVTQALREFACEFKAPQFNQVILAAPDVDAEVFRRDIAPAITGAAQQITLYASADDTALRVSQALHGAPRAGNSLVTAPGVTTIDASGLDPSLLGHSYYADLKQLIDDIGALVKQGLAPAARALFQKGDSVWELTKK
ncbi:MAG: alpha/beta hydrolase [Bacteroidota bacterium]